MSHSYDTIKKEIVEKTTQELFEGLVYWKSSTEFWLGYREMYAGLSVKSSDYSKSEVKKLVDHSICDNALTILIISEELQNRLILTK